MRILNGRITNGCQLRDFQFDLKNFNVVFGPNGSGKSNWMELVLFALGISSTLPGTQETLVTNGEAKGKVELSVEDDHCVYEITAALGKSSGRLLKSPEVRFSRQAEVKEFIERRLLRSSPDVFIRTSAIRQGMLTEGLFDPPAQQKKMFLRLAGLWDLELKRDALVAESSSFAAASVAASIASLESALADVQKSRLDAEAELQKLQSSFSTEKLQEAESKILLHKKGLEARESLARVKSERENFQTILRETNHLLESSDAQIRALRERIDSGRDKLAMAQQEKGALEAQKKKWDAFYAARLDLSNVQRSLDEIEKLLPGGPIGSSSDALRECARLKAVKDNAVKMLGILNSTDKSQLCPLCRQSLSDEQRVGLLSEFDAVKADIQAAEETALAQYRKLKEEEDSRLTAEKDRAKLLERKRLLNEMTKEVPEEPRESTVLDAVIDAEKKLNEALTTALAQRDEVNNFLKDLNNKERERVVQTAAFEGAEKDVLSEANFALFTEITLAQKEMSRTVFELQGRLKEMTLRETELRKTFASLREQEERAKKIRRYIDILDETRRILHRDYFPAVKINRFIQEILFRINDYLDKMRARFSVLFDGESGFTASFSSGHSIRADRLSGGEKVIFSLAFRFAVNEARLESGVLFLDEPTVFLDDNHIQGVVDALGCVKDRLLKRAQVVLITHEERFLSIADNVVRV